jgi:hypothetical protein
MLLRNGLHFVSLACKRRTHNEGLNVIPTAPLATAGEAHRRVQESPETLLTLAGDDGTRIMNE